MPLCYNFRFTFAFVLVLCLCLFFAFCVRTLPFNSRGSAQFNLHSFAWLLAQMLFLWLSLTWRQKVLDTELFPQHMIADLISGIIHTKIDNCFNFISFVSKESHVLIIFRRTCWVIWFLQKTAKYLDSLSSINDELIWVKIDFSNTF